MPTFAECAADPFNVAFIRRTIAGRGTERFTARALRVVRDDEFGLGKVEVENLMHSEQLAALMEGLQLMYNYKYILKLGYRNEFEFERPGDSGLRESMINADEAIMNPVVIGFCSLRTVTLERLIGRSATSPFEFGTTIVAKVGSVFTSFSIDNRAFCYSDHGVLKIGEFNYEQRPDVRNGSRKYSSLRNDEELRRFVPYAVRIAVRIPREGGRIVDFDLHSFAMMLLEDQVESQLESLASMVPLLLGPSRSIRNGDQLEEDILHLRRNGIVRDRDNQPSVVAVDRPNREQPASIPVRENRRRRRSIRF